MVMIARFILGVRWSCRRESSESDSMAGVKDSSRAGTICNR